MLAALGTIAEQQAKGTEATARAVIHLLDYCVTHPDATIRYHASDMILWIHTMHRISPQVKQEVGLGDTFSSETNLPVNLRPEMAPFSTQQPSCATH
jgi:hypothetical protein